MLKRRIAIFILSILVGLLSRSELIELPEIVDTYIGDIIWAFMVYWLFAIIFVRRSLKYILIISFVFSFLIEISQLYHAEWIDTIRGIWIFALVLGHGFLWSDLICYSMGILLGYFVERRFVK